MAARHHGQFKELISPFLRGKIEEALVRHGPDSPEHLALIRQYVRDPRESLVDLTSERPRHYQAELRTDGAARLPRGLERLYRRTVVFIPTTVCRAHCRWCLRGNYEPSTLTVDDIVAAAKYIGSPACRDDVREVLITGGDPLMTHLLVDVALAQFVRHAPNIQRVRIGTRLFMQDPHRIDADVIGIFRKYRSVHFEIGTQFNHPVEFWPETTEAVRRVQDAGVVIYNQHPLLKGVNDSFDTLAELYDRLREHRIEAHYLFHCVPIYGMSHHRTSVARGLDLVSRLSSSGAFSGRAKPMYAAMTDIGKITLYHGTLLRRNGKGEILLQSGYRLEDRRRWNPSYELPPGAEVDDQGRLRIWYQDGTDEPYTASCDEARDELVAAAP